MTPEARSAALTAARDGYLNKVSEFYDEPIQESDRPRHYGR
jgi:hypothetical protein